MYTVLLAFLVVCEERVQVFSLLHHTRSFPCHWHAQATRLAPVFGQFFTRALWLVQVYKTCASFIHTRGKSMCMLTCACWLVRVFLTVCGAPKIPISIIINNFTIKLADTTYVIHIKVYYMLILCTEWEFRHNYVISLCYLCRRNG